MIVASAILFASETSKAEGEASSDVAGACYHYCIATGVGDLAECMSRCHLLKGSQDGRQLGRQVHVVFEHALDGWPVRHLSGQHGALAYGRGDSGQPVVEPVAPHARAGGFLLRGRQVAPVGRVVDVVVEAGGFQPLDHAVPALCRTGEADDDDPHPSKQRA